MNYILHIDTATDSGSVAVSADGKILASRTTESARDHARSINIMIEEVLGQVQLQLSSLAAITVCGGPGSYTGLRIGMATAKGLCYSLDKPLMVDNRLTLLAYQAFSTNKGYDKYVVVLSAREKEYFITAHDSNFNCITEPQHITDEQLEHHLSAGKIFVISDAGDVITKNVGSDNTFIENNTAISLDYWALYAAERYDCNSTVNLSSAEPFYLKQVYTHK